MALRGLLRRWPGEARHPVRDAVTLLLALAIGAFLVWTGDATGPVPGHLPWQVDVAVGTLACVALVLRRRHPTAVAVAVVPLSAVSIMATGVILVAIFGLALRRTLPVAVAATLGYLATAPLYLLLHPEPVLPLWVDVVVRGGLAVAAVGWGLSARARQALIDQLAERAARAEADQAARLEQARRGERDRIAREMHDVMAHRLSMISLHAGALELHPDAGEEINAAAAVIRAGAHDALDELRSVMGVLREGSTATPEPPPPGLDDLEALLDEARLCGTDVRCDVHLSSVPGQRPPDGAGRVAYRVVQEALTNARKHAPGSPVDIVVDGVPGEGLRVAVTSRTAGPRPDAGVPGSGLGLVGLAERVELAGGRLVHATGSGSFRLEARLPWLT